MTLKDLLTVEHMNSRFIFLMTSVTVCICILALVAAFIFTTRQEFYPELVGILLAGGVGGAAGRWLTGRKGQPEVSSTVTTTVEKKVG